MSNTLITLSDNKISVGNSNDNSAVFYEARVLSATDYYAFGMSMKGRTWQSEKYRYGYQGSEKNEEFESSYTTEYRQLNAKISRWTSIDQKSGKYPSISPYAFVANSPLVSMEIDGRDYIILIWAVRPGDQGHAAIAIENHRQVVKNGKKVWESTGTYTVYHAAAFGSNDIEKFIANPNAIVDGHIYTQSNKTLDELKD